MNMSHKALAIAQLDAMCDEYEREFRRGKLALNHESFVAPRLRRLPEELRGWLRDELAILRRELESEAAAPAEPAAEIPSQVEPSVWRLVEQCSTFDALSREARIALACRIERCQFPAGERLLQLGAPPTGLYLVTSGTISVVAGEPEQVQPIDHDGPGAVLGEMSLLTGHPCSANVIAITPVEALRLPAEAIGGLLVEFPEIEIALSQLVSDRLGHRTQDALCGKSLGGYRLRHCISRGAMGVVYAVERQSDGSPHALKMLRHRFIYTPRVVQRFEQEAEFLRKLSHPNIVSIEDHFVEFRTRFIVLQLYDGCDLQSLVRRHGPLSESAARGILGQVAAGLRYAHANGVLHLDLKPANVLVNRLGQVAITDFGLGRLADSSEGDTELVGTPLYMPPEQFSMRDVGPHSDWYAFGCIAYELLRGERLFQTQAFRHLLEEKRRTPSTTWPDVQASEEYRLLLKTSLQPLVDHRELDLDLIASWARPVPELAPYLETPPPTAPISTKPR